MTVFCRDCKWIVLGEGTGNPRDKVPHRCSNPKQAVQDLVMGELPFCDDARVDFGLRQMTNPTALSDMNVCGPGGRYFEPTENAAGQGEDGPIKA